MVKPIRMRRTKKTETRETENKKVRNARKVVFEGITFKSHLELFCYKEMKLTGFQIGVDFLYEQFTFEVLPGFTCGYISIEQVGGNKTFKESNHKINPIRYTPDFSDKECSEFIIECKGYSNEVFPVKLKMFKKLMTESGFKGAYYLPRNQKQVREAIALIVKRRADGRTGEQQKLTFPPLPSV